MQGVKLLNDMYAVGNQQGYNDLINSADGFVYKSCEMKRLKEAFVFLTTFKNNVVSSTEPFVDVMGFKATFNNDLSVHKIDKLSQSIEGWL